MSAAVALVSMLKKGEDGEGQHRDSDHIMTLTEEARALVKALQANDISEEELLRMVNTAPSDFDACLLYTSPSPRDRG